MDVLLNIISNHSVRYLFVIINTVLNIVAYYVHPGRYSTQKYLGIISGKWFNYYTAIITFSSDIITLIGLWLLIPFTAYLPRFWYVALLVFGYGVITQITVDTQTYSKDDNLSPPPKYLINKNKRIILYTIIFLINFVVFIPFYINSGVQSKNTVRIVDVVLLNRFGGLTSSKISMYMAIFTLVSILLDGLALDEQIRYKSCFYNLPDSWNF